MEWKTLSRLKRNMCTLLATKKGKKLCAFLLLFLALLVFTVNDAWLYKTPVAKIIEVHTEKTGTSDASRGKKEIHYRQTLEGILLNGKKKGKDITLKNEYSYSGVLTERYRKGDRVFVSVNGGSLSGSIKGLKRDVYLAALIGALALLLIFISGIQGTLTICTSAANIGIFGTGFARYLNGEDILPICNIMAVVFTAATLFLLSGFCRKTWAALLSVFCVLACIMWIFDVVTAHTPEMDYSAMEYLGSLDNPGDLFRAEIMLAGLGAIMDVAVTISTALGEIIEKRPETTFLRLFWSGREIGFDIMGTMMNVLLFVFGCGLIPAFLILMNNEVGFLTIVRLHIPYEICRFLIESIGIVLAIPVSILVASVCMKLRVRRHA